MVLHRSVYFSHLILPLISLPQIDCYRRPTLPYPHLAKKNVRNFYECFILLTVSLLTVIPDSLTHILILDLSAETVSVVRTRVVSKVLVRVGKFWLAYKLPGLIRFV